MVNIFFGIVFVFIKTNLSFIDVGITYYVTNFIGYLSIFIGLKELSIHYSRLSKIQPYVIFMLVHSFIFFLLNITGNSPFDIALSTAWATVIALLGLVIVIAGMFMIFYIINTIIVAFLEEANEIYQNDTLQKLYKAMFSAFLLAGVSFFFSTILSKILMGILLLINILFLIRFYYVFLTKNKTLV